jgi:hypothetical protein
VAGPAADLESGSSQPSSDAFDDQRPFQLRDGTDDDHDGAAERSTCIELFPEADELDL